MQPQAAQPLPPQAVRTHFRPFVLSFEHSGVIAEVYNSRVIAAEQPWLMLTNDLVIAAVQKHVLQICRRYLRDIRSAHVAVQLATTVFHSSFGSVAHLVPLAVARDRPSLFLEDFQFVVMVVCLATVSIASKLEAQVPYVHLTNLLHDYLQRPLAVPPVKAFVVRTESEILQLVGWDALQPSQLSLGVMEKMLGILHSDHSIHAEALTHFVNRVDDSLMNFVARHRTTGTTACLDAWQLLQRLRNMSVEEFMLHDAATSMSPDEARVQIVVNSPCTIFPLVAVHAAAQLLRMEHSDARHVLKFMGMELSDELCVFYGHILEDIANQAANDLLQNYQQPIDLLPDYGYSMLDQALSAASMSKFVTRCIQASVRFLVARLRLVCGPQSRKKPAPVAAEPVRPRSICVSPPHGFLPHNITVTPAPTTLAQPPLQMAQLPMPQPQVLNFAGHKMHREEMVPTEYDYMPTSKRFCGPAAVFPHSITAFTPPLHTSPTDITASLSAPDEEVGPIYPSMCGLTFNDLSYGTQATVVKTDHLYHEVVAPQAFPTYPVHPAGIAEMSAPQPAVQPGFQQLPFHHHHQPFYMVQGPTPQYIFT